ncbi:hypothetical protein KBTX_03184 [wastewater metagenome]|uniref:Lipoprotein n=3 Tax=root TaxID=1 RepID=A0A5B8RFQ0_9ZZZZ|nr:hypothetical protein KBTEX_03184 [uncultured organism]
MSTMRNRRWIPVVVAVMLTALLAGCASYGEQRVAPIPMPASQADSVTVNGATLLARAYLDPDTAEEAFGFDIRGAGLLPVQFVVDNTTTGEVRIDDDKMLLIDREGNAWPVLSADQALERVRTRVEQGEAIRSGARSSLLTALAGAIAGAAIGVVSGDDVVNTAGKGAAVGAAAGALGGGVSGYANVGKDIRRDLAERSMRDRVIQPGELAYGFMFFPGAKEAQSVERLRLSVVVDGERQTLQLPVSTVTAGGNE